ncbi:hypothetical protein DENSPDRAFT_841528 [Dentipellis sp. KUC8613]|nr:hypothetical protein DENSPDRAFT_841528 [Dentipellis sp. KUC8613]
MANPRQRRKARSSSYKPVNHSRRAKKILKKQPAIRGPKVLQEAWDKRKTVLQNYAALGLSASLNPRTSGGVESVKKSREEGGDSDNVQATGQATELPESESSVPKGYGRIIRDEEGNIVDVEMEDETEEVAETAKTTLIEERASFINPETASWVNLGRDTRHDEKSSRVVQALETVSSTSTPVPRFSSNSEKAYLQRLIAKHKQDVDAMARDRGLNPDQRTAGELRRAIRKAGGFEKLVSP